MTPPAFEDIYIQFFFTHIMKSLRWTKPFASETGSFLHRCTALTQARVRKIIRWGIHRSCSRSGRRRMMTSSTEQSRRVPAARCQWTVDNDRASTTTCGSRRHIPQTLRSKGVFSVSELSERSAPPPQPRPGLISITAWLAIYHTAPKSTEVIKYKEKVV